MSEDTQKPGYRIQYTEDGWVTWYSVGPVYHDEELAVKDAASMIALNLIDRPDRKFRVHPMDNMLEIRRSFIEDTTKSMKLDVKELWWDGHDLHLVTHDGRHVTLKNAYVIERSEASPSGGVKVIDYELRWDDEP